MCNWGCIEGVSLITSTFGFEGTLRVVSVALGSLEGLLARLFFSAAKTLNMSLSELLSSSESVVLETWSMCDSVTLQIKAV